MIRPGEEKDIPAVALLWYRMAKELLNGTAGEQEPLCAWWANITWGLMKSGNYHLWLADKDEEIIGFIDYLDDVNLMTNELFAALRSYYVMPEYRRTKAAYYLWSTFLADLRERKSHYIESNCEEKMVVFWRKRGFEVLPRIRRQLMEA
jgi:GNAT superfamily N-acetyltransferase